ncbi:MAG: hypothetical protein A3D24_00870 [Candidatus Blackburnbacteria bacterium RIFCSPHIGHO2_02_FULL_39_13]|uniref:Putative pre-16S rRNA nuclease n=1 Tax=Candidatus Blackburnbacteria bacterium RIFCSPLOWO2_01_FULL_40_20 TaxID=1797519 RepID=A0A1G1VBB0_9BACT|nr:MAG: hypothetical protein A2694_00020 [Candidatus Blackburnbacteria bacterium RIFCSPHIGHO2_01_FULL_40_17]OGY07878.1 MAG: hypothetical protein A3D24_00870 [Candidatus Blackburnbacteria bacterium RIFCSPHIGHO2_02_FULL_39_13]OGY12601.1 MAG: hypothetical protein A3A77_04975 [Candidatus Blackburnbacteria bacterium RIFCSPLOWO2_01_FULL_40_20]OGY14738.1 MAG: hypothetical protein A3I52_02855 [Candidatus Blackburnbacteria bacterium RIFCSPLOWO2_02_FULL_40_10]
MIILGVDYGRSKMGLSLSSGNIAFPLKVIRVSSQQNAIEEIQKVVKEENAEKVVVGISEGKMADEEIKFSKDLEKVLGVKVETWDETLSTQDAQELSLSAQLPQKRRKEMEDAFSSTLVLQSYLDAHGTES